MKTRQEVILQLQGLHREELAKLSLKERIAKLATLLAKYRIEHPEESEAWSAQYA